MILNRYKQYFPILLIMILTFLLGACGTATPAEFQDASPDLQQEQEDPVGESNQNNENDEPTNEGSFIKDPSSADIGLEMGITDTGNFYMGDPNAPVIIEEFSDFQCPYCSRFTFQTLPELIKNQIANGEAMLVYYDFPLDNIHPQAAAAANAARCAGEQGAVAYWTMHDKLYQQPERWSQRNPNTAFSEFASEIGLDLANFDPCIEEFRYEEEIKADTEFAISRGVRSTPSFFVNDQPLVGAQPLAAFNQAIAAVLAGESIVTEAPQQQPAESPLQPPVVKPTPAVISDDNYAFQLGDPNAPVKIVEFTDFQCPYCQRYTQQTFPQIMETMIENGTVHYIFKDLPLDSIHPNARTASLAARCAGEQNSYLEMHDAIFNDQGEWSAAGDELINFFTLMAADLGLDESSFESCMEENRYGDAIQANVNEALSIGANSTPYFFVNGFPLAGAQSIEVFNYAVDLAIEDNLAEAYVPPAPDLSQSFTLGDPDAPVTIIEYTDYQCPFCSRHYQQTFKKIQDTYIDTGQVYYVFKDFPLTNIHPQAVEAAEAARCAGDQGLFLEMHDILFSSQSEWSGRSQPGEIFARYAEELNIDKEEFKECMQSDVHEPGIAADLSEGSQRGISGTPAFIINGYSMSGAQPYEIFSQAIDQFLNES